jgi:hypothetical protein
MEPSPKSDEPPACTEAKKTLAGSPTPEPPPKFKITPNAWALAQWGLASVLLNATGVVLMPVTMIIYTLIPMSIQQVPFWDKPSMIAASVLMPGISGLMLLFALVGLVFAFSGGSVAKSRKQPQALHAVGSMIAILGLLCWVGATIGSTVLAFGIWNIH